MATDDGWATADFRPAPQGRGPLPDINTSTPNIARVYDYLLGGKDNFAADRLAAEELAEKAPEVWLAARHNRYFLVRAVRTVAEVGIRQFIDLGSGFPTSPNVHEVARTVHPEARVVYVDNDPVVAVHGRALNAVEKTAVAEADLRRPDEILTHPDLRELIDFTEPVAVLFVAVLHFLDDQHSVAAVSRFREAMVPGSYLVVSHASPGGRTDIDEAVEIYRKRIGDIWPRTPEQVRPYFAGMELLEPGLVPVQEWRPELADPDLRIPKIPGLPEQHRAPQGVFLAGVGRT